MCVCVCVCVCMCVWPKNNLGICSHLALCEGLNSGHLADGSQSIVY